MRAAALFVTGAALVPAQEPVLRLTFGSREASFPMARLKAMARDTIEAQEQGKPVRFRGVPLRLLLNELGIPAGEPLRGPALGATILAEGADGYRAAFGLAEMDPGFSAQPLSVAFERDGQRLDAKEGPLRLIAPADKRAGR